ATSGLACRCHSATSEAACRYDQPRTVLAIFPLHPMSPHPRDPAMRYSLFVCSLACLGAALPATRAAAQAIPPAGIYTTANPKTPRYPEFVTASESPRGLVLKTPKAEIPADQIDDIIFPLNPVGVRVSTYRLGIIAEKKGRAAAKPADRAREYAEALGK